MKQKLNASIILALLMSFAIIGCNDPKNDEAQKTETATMPDFDPAMDATKMAGYPAKILADTLNLKAYEFLVNPGDTVPLHAHPDHVLYVVEGGTAEIKGKDGKTQATEFKAGTCMISGPDAHSAKITGSTAIKLLIVHVYRPRG
jgi:quercetin dioxygenase-like cupin family protein